jgi:dolichyl-phosphate-mannose--protein O-mannosyl transferase
MSMESDPPPDFAPARPTPDAAPAYPTDEIVPSRAARHLTRRAWWQRPAVVILAVTAFAGGLRFYHLSAPHAYVFDETYYAKDGCFDAGYPFKECHLDNPSEQTFTVHPPLGRWIIAGSEKAFGNRPFGWRFASAVAGTLSVTLTAILAYVMFGSALYAGIAGLLLATEALNFVQSRVSMLDIFLTLFVVAGFLFVALDRQWMRRRTPEADLPEPTSESALLAMPPDRAPSPILRPWRVAAGLAFGAATATKWSGATALVGGIVFTVAWERGRRRELGLRRPTWETIRDESFGMFLFLVLLPLAVYAASYARWFADNGIHFSSWWDVQRAMLDYSLQLRAKHPYSSRPWTWPLLIRPVSYYYKGATVHGQATSAEILGMGNPFVFWVSLLALPYAALAGWLRRDWRAGLTVTAYASQYFPWYAAARTIFFFYMAPVTPFMVLAMVYGIRDVAEIRSGDKRVLAPLAGLVVLACVGVFFYFFPILVGRVISYPSWHQRMWLPKWI